MRIVAALAWYAETPEFLDRCVRSLAGVADEVVALDGAWEHFEISVGPSEGSAVIRRTAASVGLQARVYEYDGYWDSQVVKRAELMKLAGERSDFVLVIDADEYIAECDAPTVRATLKSTDRDVAEVTIRNLNRPWPYEHLAPQAFAARRLYRAGTTVPGPAHNDYERDGVKLNGDPARHELAEPLRLTAHLVVAHDNRNRSPEREWAAQTYRRARRLERVEAPA